MKYFVGIEHEVPFINSQGKFAVWTKPRFGDFQAIVAEPPLYPADQMIAGSPWLTQKARRPAQIGRIEFKAFDSSINFQHCARMATLLKGLTQERSLTGRRVVPDARLHQRSARLGLNDPQIYRQAGQILDAVACSLSDSAGAARPKEPKTMPETRQTPAQAMIESFHQSPSIEMSLLRGLARVEHTPFGDRVKKGDSNV